MTRRTITTDATGRRESFPELTTVEIAARGEGESARTARERARDRAATIRASLTETSVSDEHVGTVELRVEEGSQTFGCDDVPYRAVERLRVDCVPETAAEVVVAATDAGGAVPHVQFQLHEETRRELQEEALAAATGRAREKAERIAATEGLTIAGVRAVTTREASVGMESVVEEALAGTPDPDFSPDPIAVTETVEVVYELGDGPDRGEDPR